MKASYNVTIRAVGADAIAVLLGTIGKTSYLTLVSVQEVPNGEASAPNKVRDGVEAGTANNLEKA